MVCGKKRTDVKPAWEWEEDDFPLEERMNVGEPRRTGTLVCLSAGMPRKQNGQATGHLPVEKAVY